MNRQIRRQPNNNPSLLIPIGNKRIVDKGAKSSEISPKKKHMRKNNS